LVTWGQLGKVCARPALASYLPHLSRQTSAQLKREHFGSLKQYIFTFEQACQVAKACNQEVYLRDGV